MKKNKKVIDTSGFGNSGRTALCDLFREFNDVKCTDHLFEFNLLRFPDGIIDLYYNIYLNWTPIKSDFAIKRFTMLIENLSYNYKENLTNNFEFICKDYINSLITDQLEVNGWVDYFYNQRRSLKAKNTLAQFLKKLKLLSLAKTIKRKIKTTNLKEKKDIVYLVENKNFLEKTKEMLKTILFEGHNCSTMVINNAFEPFNPSLSMKFFDEAYCIIVNRDPRDIYASNFANKETLGLTSFEKHHPSISFEKLVNLRKEFLGTENIEIFIKRQKLYRKNLKNINNKRVLNIWFEDLVLNYEDTLQVIYSFLNLDEKEHINKKLFFDPEQSKKNCYIWKNFPGNKEIEKIQNELNDYLYLAK